MTAPWVWAQERPWRKGTCIFTPTIVEGVPRGLTCLPNRVTDRESPERPSTRRGRSVADSGEWPSSRLCHDSRHTDLGRSSTRPHPLPSVRRTRGIHRWLPVGRTESDPSGILPLVSFVESGDLGCASPPILTSTPPPRPPPNDG